MRSLAQLAANATDLNFTEYIFPDSDADPVQETESVEDEINLPQVQDEKIKYMMVSSPQHHCIKFTWNTKSAVIVKLISVFLMTFVMLYNNILRMDLILSP